MTVTVDSLLNRLGLSPVAAPSWQDLSVIELTGAQSIGAPLQAGLVRLVIASDCVEGFDHYSADGPYEIVITAMCTNGVEAVPTHIGTRRLVYKVEANELERIELKARSILSEDAAAEARRVLDDVRRLNRVATAGDPSQIVSDLSKLLNGWAVVVDTSGEVLAAAGAGRIHLNDAVAAAMGKQVRIRDANIQVHSFGARTSAPGYLVVSGRIRSVSRVRALAEHASALINLTLHGHDHTATEVAARSMLTDFIREPKHVTAATIATKLGLRGELAAFRISTSSGRIDLESMVSRWLQELRTPLIYRTANGFIAGFLLPGIVDKFPELVRRVSDVADLQFTLGLSDTHPVEDAGRAWSEAEVAHRIGLNEGRALCEYPSLPNARLQRLGGSLTDHFVDVLSPLRRLSNGEQLLHELFYFLSTNGNLGESAERAGVHRHTMRSHIQQIEAACKLSFSSMTDRTFAWLSLVNDGLSPVPTDEPVAGQRRRSMTLPAD